MRFLSLALALVLISGCASTPQVTLSTADHSFVKSFEQSYSSVTPGGDDVIVLRTDSRGEHGAAGFVHVLRIRTLWHPVNGAKPNSPAATNAALHYFVTDPLTGGYLHYAGTGFVTVEHDRSKTKVMIRNAKLAVAESHGSLNDPLHAFTLSGEFEAVEDSHQVGLILAELSRTVPKIIAAPTTSPTPRN